VDKISILIPSYNEPYLGKTLKDILKKAEGDIEILVNLDSPHDNLVKDKRITYFHNDKPLGMRGGINRCLKASKGKYIIKVDAHCLFAQGFDRVLLETMQDDWLVIPRRYSLHGDWKREMRMPYKDYHYLSYPQDSKFYGFAMFPVEWRERTKERADIPIDDTMIFQGSFWLANKDYFMKRVGLLDDSPDTYSTFSGEQLEIGLKYWLGGGQVKVNKNTWYAHLFKNKRYYTTVGNVRDRKYKINLKAVAGWEWTAKHWLHDKEPNMIHKFSWLLEKFWPVPGWPEDRRLWSIKRK